MIANPDNQQPIKGGTFSDLNFPRKADLKLPEQPDNKKPTRGEPSVGDVSSSIPDKELDDIKLSISFTERQLDDMKPGDEIEIGLTDEAKQRLNKLLKEAYQKGKEDGLQSK